MHGMGYSEAETLRLDDRDRAAADTRAEGPGAGGSLAVAAKTKTVSTYPTAAGRYYACETQLVTGTETEGGTGTLTAAGDTVYAFNVGSAIPPSGTTVMLTWVSYRFVGKEVGAIRDSVRELKGMQGAGTTTDDVIVDLMELRAKTGLKQEEARQFSEQFKSGIFTAEIAGNLGAPGKAREDLEEGIMEETALFAARNGIDLQAAGTLAASILTAGPVKSKEEYATRLARTTQGAVEGQGNLSPFATALTRSIAEFGTMADEEGKGSGKIGNPEDVGILLGVMSTASGSPMVASRMLNQGLRGLFSFEGKQGDFLQNQAKIKPTDDAMTAMRKIQPFLARAERSGEGADYFLQQQGFGNERERNALAYLSRNLGVAEERIARIHGGTFGADASKLNHEFLGSKEGQNRLAGVQADLGRVSRGLPEEGVEAARLAAEGRLRAEGNIDTTGTNFVDRIGSILSFGGVTGRQKRVDDEVRGQLLGEAERVGVDAGARFPGRSVDPKGTLNPFTEIVPLQELIATLAPEIAARGGQPIGDANEGVEVLKQIRDKLDAMGKGGPGPAPTPRPGTVRPVAPARPGA
jgi:hypothetical protein